MFSLEPHGPDTYVGTGPRYPWGGLYGGQIVAQALMAATHTVEPGYTAHSIRAYFIRPGDHTEPVRYEVDRIRNGRSFVTRRVVARQAIGAILNAECSYQADRPGFRGQPIIAPDVADPESVENTSFSTHFDRRWVTSSLADHERRDGAGRVAAWMRVTDPVDDPLVLHQAWLAYISDDLPSDTVRSARAALDPEFDRERVGSVSLDHTIWFHRPLRADRWHLHDFSCHHLADGRGLALGHVFDDAGTHVATVVQEVLLREHA